MISVCHGIVVRECGIKLGWQTTGNKIITAGPSKAASQITWGAIKSFIAMPKSYVLPTP